MKAGTVTTSCEWNFTLPLYAALYAGPGVCWLFLNPKGTLFDEEPR